MYDISVQSIRRSESFSLILTWHWDSRMLSHVNKSAMKIRKKELVIKVAFAVMRKQ